ncbi:MAG TPA: YdcF family protein [Pyrinomonadaceae bacterium]|jgi:uncharacterized SAM-binding protein YcdF (DUF218 family)
MKTFFKILAAICLGLVLFIVFIAGQIYFYDESSENQTADAAIVLGAAVWGERLSPVFQERVNHAVNLYRAGRVKKIIFTGGQGNADEETEAAAARRFAIASGIPAEDILMEDKSTSTYENLALAKPITNANGIKTVLLVSDPLHLKRSIEIAKSLNYEVYPSPTPTTKYRGFKSRMKLLAHETYYYAGFLIRSTFNFSEG